MAAYFWVGGSGTWSTGLSFNWATTSGGGASGNSPTAADTATFDANSGAAATVTVAATAVSLSTTVNKADITLTLSGSPTLCTTAGTLTFTAGTINLAGFTLSTGIFSSNNANTRAIAFGSGNIALTSTTAATAVLSMATATGFTWTGTGSFVRNQVATATVTFGTTGGGSATNAPNLTVNAGSSDLTISATSFFKNVNFTGSFSTVSGQYSVCGTITVAAGGVYTGLTLVYISPATLTNFSPQVGGILINAPGSTITLGGNFTLPSLGAFTLFAGTLDLNGFTLSVDYFSGSGTSARAIAFGTSNIVLTAGPSSVTLSMPNATNFSWTGTGGFVRSQINTTTVTFGTTGGTTTNAPNLTVNAGASLLTVTTGSYFRNVNFTGSTCTVTGNFNVCGNLTLISSITYPQITFLTSGTLIGSGAAPSGLVINAPGGTVTFGSDIGLTGTFTLSAGTLNLGGFVLSAGTFSSNNTTVRSVIFGSSNITLTGGSGTVINMAQADNFTWTGTGGFARTQGIGPSSATFAFGSFSGGASTNAPNINVTGVFTNTSITLTSSWFKNVTLNGNVSGIGSYSAFGDLTLGSVSSSSLSPTFGSSATITSNGQSLGNVTINASGGTVTLGDALTSGVTATVTLTNGTLDLAGFNLSTGNFSSNNANTRAIAFGTGNITLSSTVAGNTVLSMATATNFTFTGTGGFVRNQAATATVFFGFTGGSTTNAPNLTVNAGASTLTITSNSYFKNVDFTGSTCIVTGTCSVCGDLTLASGGTYAGAVFIFLTSGTLTTNSKTISALTVNGSGITVTLADALTTNGALTFTNGTLQLKSGATTTVGSFVTTGTTLKYLQSTTPGVQATISDISGTNTATYLSIQDSNATGGAVWDATSATNVDAGNNTGWRGLVLVPVTGVSATGVIGDVTIYLLLVVSATGVQVIGVIGDVVVTGTAFVYPIGVVAYGLIGPVNVWGLVIDGQVPNWTIIADGQTPTWAAVSNPQTPSWQPVVN